MMKFGPIQFHDAILDELQRDRLVVFAGAGVSMGEPSNLDDFLTLSEKIAIGTGETPRDPNDRKKAKEPLDRFLGALQHRGVKVHERAATVLSPPASLPNALHHNLLRLFRRADRVRLVTTNFDLHFEAAAQGVFGDTAPAVYRAPALPLGHDFTGIVYVHGALPAARSLVLTDADFGRAYLTEGWARRFLVDAFATYTVLFVGYSHTDTAMHYLARALPANRDAGRFALTDDVDGNWSMLGIRPIRFVRSEGPDLFKDLYDGVQNLAERVARGPLDWRSRLTELGSLLPPTDEEVASEIKQALREVHTTRFLLDVARGPEWLRWLSARRYLDTLFNGAELGERDMLLVEWVTRHFTIAYQQDLLELLAAHELHMNPVLWLSLARQLAFTKEPVAEATLKRWVSVLLACAPSIEHRQELQWLAKLCAEQGQVEVALGVFMAMSRPRLDFKAAPTRPYVDDADSRHQLMATCSLSSGGSALHEVWSTHLKPCLPQIALPLLSGTTLYLEEMYRELATWDRASREWDPVSSSRAAIERHAQNKYPEPIDVLIDAARDALESVAAGSPLLLSSWIERLIVSEVPMLRRLAIHAATVHPELSADGRLEWLLQRVGLHGFPEHHEVHRAVAQNYANSSELVRQSIVNAVLALARPAYPGVSAEIATAKSHFSWLSWLLGSKPDCALAGAAIAAIKEEHPDWQTPEHSDFMRWRGPVEWTDTKSPWSIEQLLAREPWEQLDELLTFKGDRFYEPSREGLLPNIREACKQNVGWAFALFRALKERRAWVTDLWSALLGGLRGAELTIDQWRELLTCLSAPELQSEQTYHIANLLHRLVEDGGEPFALKLLAQSNPIAYSIWLLSQPNEQDEGDVEDWLSHAVNRSPGVIVNFWLHGLSLLVNEKDGPERAMPDDYRQWLTMVVQDETPKGGMGRSLLASQSAFLFHLDEIWTRQYVVPLFSETDRPKFNQAWDGFFTWGHLTPALADALTPAFGAVFPRRSNLNDKHSRFIEYYTSLIVYYASDPTQQLLPILLEHASVEERVSFASHLGHHLRHIAQADRQRLWDSWVHRYWRNRVEGVPKVLDEKESLEMLKWLPSLGDAFPEAVALAVRFEQAQVAPTSLAFALSSSELVERFPIEAAELLIYLTNCSGGYHATHLAEIDARLTEIPAQLRHRIDEAFAQAGVQKKR